MITQDQLIGLSKQVFILEYLINGLFPCQSDVVRLLRATQRDWTFNDKFEYRMLLATTNTGGSLNSQVFKENVGLVKPGSLEYGIYQATYGTVGDGFDVDMMKNLETEKARAAFENDYATRMHSLRVNVAAQFKNFAIRGSFGVLYQITSQILAPNLAPGFNPQPQVFTPVLGVPFTHKVPIDVFHSNFKQGKYLIKTTEADPRGAANVAELYQVLENQPGWITLLPCGTAVSPWEDGQFVEVQGNREIVGMPATIFQNWNYGAITVATGPFQGVYDQFAGTGAYTAGANAIVGSMEGLADLFPWYTDPAAPEVRLGVDMPFRGQPNRLRYSTEQCGGWVVQQPGEHIIDAIMRGSFLTKATVPYADVGIWINPVTRAQMGYEEGDNVRVLRDNFVAGPIIYQRGVKTTDYQIGTQVVREVVEDFNIPTDIIIIGPKNDMSYNCWDNTTFKIDEYIHETFGKSPPPDIADLPIPDDMIATLDISNRIVIGSPSMLDGRLANFMYGNGIRHPKNSAPIALQEMGCLFTEFPYTYTIVKLRNQIVDITTV